MNNIQPLCAIPVLLLLASCSTFQSRWPEQAPPKEYYLSSYSDDSESSRLRDSDTYLLWIGRFYNGLNVIPGWEELTEQIVTALPGQKDELEPRLYELGRRISAEWARHPRVRRINSRMANVWRDALLEARDRGEILQFLSRIEQDVDHLLAEKICAEDIYFERYYVDPYDF